MYYKLNKMYDNLQYTYPGLRFLIFACICFPIAFIPVEEYKTLTLFAVILFRGGYFTMAEWKKE